LGSHDHVFLGEGHERDERRTWMVIALCSFMMVAEIVGGLLFGSIALVADGLHMSTHTSALLLAALAYRDARHHADHDRFTFDTGKLGDLAGYTSAIVLASVDFGPVVFFGRASDPRDANSRLWPPRQTGSLFLC
jgi:Co/Zn/Cd efflux system component